MWTRQFKRTGECLGMVPGSGGLDSWVRARERLGPFLREEEGRGLGTRRVSSF